MATPTEKEWPCWADVLGQTYYPGDTVAIAVVNDKSPQLVIGRVERINKINSKGEEITRSRLVWKNPEEAGNYRAEREWVTEPSCTVTITPLIDARGFSRWSGTGGYRHGGAQNKENVKKVTYQFPENIIKVETPVTTGP